MIVKQHFILGLLSLTAIIGIACGQPAASPTPAPTEAPDLQATIAARTEATIATLPASGDAAIPATTLNRFTINQAKHPEAVYNDATTPLFYYRRGVGEGVNKWVFYFKGGGTCYSKETCLDRERNLMSADYWMRPNRRELSVSGGADGIFNSDPTLNPDFYNWNHVYMVYGSSDSWSGTREASPETGNLNFRGHFVVDAIIDALLDPSIVGTANLANATHVLLSGSSAGAGGLRHNVDRLAESLSWADVRAVHDASIAPFVDLETVRLAEAAEQMRWDIWDPILDASCQAAHSSNPWACLPGAYVIANNYINTPIFGRMDQLDPLPLRAQNLARENPSDRAQVEAFGAEIRSILEAMTGAFSPRSSQHVCLNTDCFYSYEIDGYTMAEVLGNWYFDRPGPKMVIEHPSASPTPTPTPVSTAATPGFPAEPGSHEPSLDVDGVKRWFLLDIVPAAPSGSLLALDVLIAVINTGALKAGSPGASRS